MGLLTWTAFSSGAVATALKLALPDKAYFAMMTAWSIGTLLIKMAVVSGKKLAREAYEKYTQVPLTVSSDPEHIPAATMRKPRVIEVANFDYSPAHASLQ